MIQIRIESSLRDLLDLRSTEFRLIRTETDLSKAFKNTLMRLTEEQIQYGFYYYFHERKNDIAKVTEVSEYAGEEELIINCT